MKRKSTQRIPPDDDSIKFHALQCNYITNVSMNSYMQHHSPPPPNNYGWTKVDGQYHPVRHTLPSLPQPPPPGPLVGLNLFAVAYFGVPEGLGGGSKSTPP